MIVLSHQNGWKIITQRSHGLLAAMLAYQYKTDLPVEMMVPVLVAIAEHDDGVTEMLADENLTAAGAPRSFTVDDGRSTTDIAPLQSLMEIANAKSELNGLLASLHIKFLYGRANQENDKRLGHFLKEQEEYRATVLKNLKLTKKYADWLYRLLEWSDAFSLLICQDKIQPEGRKMEISESPDGDMNSVYYKSNNDICVEPWPFTAASFKVYYEYKIVEQLQFSSIEEFNEAYKAAKIQRQVFTLAGVRVAPNH